MAKPTVLEELPVTMSEVAEELKLIKERDGELNFRANKTEEYLQQFHTLPVKDAQALMDEITKLDIPRLKQVHIAKLVDIRPQSVDDVKIVLQGQGTLSVNQQNMKKIADAMPKD